MIETRPIPERFLDRLTAYDVEYTVADPEDVETVVEDVVSQPAVGVESSTDAYGLPDTVSTSFSPADLEAAATGVTEAVLGIAEYGSIVIPTTTKGMEPVSLFADEHVAILDASDIVPGMEAAFDRLGDQLRTERTSAIIATGPSATADMGALVTGAHGPKSVHVIIVNQ
ncbi:LUD domain-containing protein [Halobaculum sp. EA56]|uniref:LUD domain-containing protein n=1 Tax=Halobacteriales TaxID=2235 RepID=UPI003EC13166